MEQQTNTSKKSLLPILLALLVIMILGVLVSKYSGGVNKNKQNFTSENVIVTKTSSEHAVPAGFLSTIPVELANITESTTLAYPDRKAVLYSVSYVSTKQQDELFALYTAFLKSGGYVVKVTDKSLLRMMYQATKDKNDITIVITPQSGKSTVQISYVVRQ